MQNRANPPAAGSPTATSLSDKPVVASSVANPDRASVADRRASDDDIDLVQQRDEAYQRMLEAVDALRGAQAEQAAARARVAELEHQVHVYVAENEHLHSLVQQRSHDGLRQRVGALARTVGAAASAASPGRATDTR